ncbi:hypothetical protein COLO4_35863 [Corchorus olitorius]|uniref:Uncharacterized protein n=1 Tax=Corchorus olitorius TaxID=93759 RepID=A0A1R3GCL5_9ROSI|nr:hypothetical protein COLO4_35863 [Corchorus olitorius]
MYSDLTIRPSDELKSDVDDAELAEKSSQLNITCLVGTLVACSEPIMSCHIGMKTPLILL